MELLIMKCDMVTRVFFSGGKQYIIELIST